jgi:hypothetical protein
MKMALNTTKNPKQTSFKSSVSCDNPKFSCEYIPVETLFTTCRLCVCVIGISILTLSTISQLKLGTVPILWYVLFSFHD